MAKHHPSCVTQYSGVVCLTIRFALSHCRSQFGNVVGFTINSDYFIIDNLSEELMMPSEAIILVKFYFVEWKRSDNKEKNCVN